MWWVVVAVVVVGSLVLLLFGTSLSLISKTEERGMHVRLALAVCGFLLWLLKLGACMHAAATEKCPRHDWTAGAVRFALEHISTDKALVLNGDSYCDFDYRVFKSFHDAQDADASILLTYVEDCSRYGSVVLDKDGKVESFIEKSGAGGAGFINAGVYLMERALIKEIPAGRILSLEKDVFPQWIGRQFCGHASNAPMFIDIGTPQSFHHAQSLFSGRTNS